MAGAAWRFLQGLWQLSTALLALLGAFLAFGPYQDDRTWNLMRNAAQTKQVDVPGLPGPTHFRLRQLQPLGGRSNKQDPKAPPLLFVPGHQGKWTQAINIAAYFTERRRAVFYATDFHASASALHHSIVEQQAAFTAASIRTIAQLHKAQAGVTLIGHSMGGVVLQRALQLLRRSGEEEAVSAMLFISSPIMGHPLLLEPSMAHLAKDLRQQLLQTSLLPPIVAISGGETDPLIPAEVAALPQGVKGSSLLMPAMHNVYSSFSHVNLLFSRHSLHSLSNLLNAALQGTLLDVAERQRSPFAALQLRGEATQTAATALAAALLKEAEGEQNWRLRRKGFVTFNKEELEAALQEEKGEVAKWEDFEAGCTHVLPARPGAAAFTLLVLEQPRRIKRSPEPSTRGEDFDPKDIVDCGSFADVRVAIWREGSVAWQNVTALVLQYPQKACVWHMPLPNGTLGAVATVMAHAHRPPPIVQGWAQWHEDSQNGPVQPFLPIELRLPAGHPVLSRLILDDTAWALPLDFQVSSRSSSPWGLAAVLAAVYGNDAQVFAAHPTAGASSWAAESNPDVFTPRFTANNAAPQLLILSNPSEELRLKVRVNYLSLLARCFRNYLGYILGAWLGALLALQALPGNVAAVWLLLSTAMTAIAEKLQPTSQLAVPSPGMLLWLHFLGAGLAFCSWTITSSTVKVAAFCCRSGRARWRTPLLLDIVLWGALAAAHPACCLLLMCLWAMLQLATVRSKTQAVQDLPGRASLIGEASGEATCGGLLWMQGFVAVLWLFLLTNAPSLVLTVWVLLGQHREASTAQLHNELQTALKTSIDAPTPWVDSLIFSPGSSSVSSFLGLLAPAAALLCFKFKRTRSATGSASSSVPLPARALLLALAVSSVALTRHYTHHVWLVAEVALFIHAATAAVDAFRATGSCKAE